MEKEIILLIDKPDDSGKHYDTSITVPEDVTFRFGGRQRLFEGASKLSYRCSVDRGAKDPVHSGIVSFWRNALQRKRKSRSNWYHGGRWTEDYQMVVKIRDMPMLLKCDGTRYSLNGVTDSLVRICDTLARVTFKSVTNKDTNVLMKTLYSYQSMPENIRYVLENKVPFHFFESFVKYEVRLNIQQIDESEFAIEISDGIWGSISQKDLIVFVNTYLHGKKRGNWKNLTPAKLYERLVGREPTGSEQTLMVEFLKQNRTSDIVEKRAIELVKELENQYKGRISVLWKDEQPSQIAIQGKVYDGLLTARNQKAGYQMVSTHVYQPREKGDEYVWRGPICIDNMTKDSSLGDQFAARTLALINDTMTMTIVSTIRSYIKEEPNKNRIDINEMHGMWMD